MNNILNLIEKKDIKLTQSRKTILELLSNSEKPICYEEVKDQLDMDKATFYRNISKFEEKEIINSFESNDRKRYYEINEDKHSHFVCNICSKIECIHEELEFNLPNYKVENIIIKGVCQECLIKE